MRTAILTLRFTPAELAIVKARAAVMGLSASAFARMVLIGSSSSLPVSHQIATSGYIAPPLSTMGGAPAAAPARAELSDEQVDDLVNKMLAGNAPSDGATTPDPDDLSDMDGVDWSTDPQD